MHLVDFFIRTFYSKVEIKIYYFILKGNLCGLHLCKYTLDAMMPHMTNGVHFFKNRCTLFIEDSLFICI
jgi:hypothetical protein